MKRVFTADNLATVVHVRTLLQSRGIRCILRNENLAGGMGGLPTTECWPEVWICDDADYQAARRLTQTATAPPPGGNDWHCPGCAERHEAQFTHCWHCGTERPAAPA